MDTIKEIKKHYKHYKKYEIAEAYQLETQKTKELNKRFSRLQKENANLRYELKKLTLLIKGIK